MKVGQPCRKKKSECDVTETCTGLSEWCPKDVYYYNGMQCGNKSETVSTCTHKILLTYFR